MWGVFGGKYVIYVLSQSLTCYIQYHTILNRVMAVPDRISAHSSIALHPYTAGCPTMLPVNKWKGLLHECTMPGTLLIFIMSWNESHHYFIRLRDTSDVNLISLDIIICSVISILNFDNQIQCHIMVNFRPNPHKNSHSPPLWVGYGVSFSGSWLLVAQQCHVAMSPGSR